MHVVADVGPAAVVLNAVGAAAVPLDLRLAQSGKLVVGRNRTVGLGQKDGAIELAIAAAAFRQDALSDDQDEAIETRVAGDIESAGYDQHAGAAIATEVKVTIHKS